MVICCVLECIKKSYTTFTDAQLQKTAIGLDSFEH